MSAYSPASSSPGVVGVRDAVDIGVGQPAVGAVLHLAQLAGVYEEDLFAAVAEAPVPLVACEEPEADRNLGGVEELTRKRDHAVHEVGLDDVLADLALARGIGGYGAVGEHEAREACGY